MTINQDSLNARNITNFKANEVEGHLLRILSPWQGKKIWKTSGYGGLVARLQRELDAYCADHVINTPDSPWRLTLRSDVAWLTAELSHRTDTTGYTRETLYLGKRDYSGVLTELGECQQRPQFELADVVATADRARALEQEARELRSSISCFAR